MAQISLSPQRTQRPRNSLQNLICKKRRAEDASSDDCTKRLWLGESKNTQKIELDTTRRFQTQSLSDMKTNWADYFGHHWAGVSMYHRDSSHYFIKCVCLGYPGVTQTNERLNKWFGIKMSNETPVWRIKPTLLTKDNSWGPFYFTAA